jgi:hypothetical protein
MFGASALSRRCCQPAKTQIWRACAEGNKPAYYAERGQQMWLTIWRDGHRQVIDVWRRSKSAQANISQTTQCRQVEDERMYGRAWVANAKNDTYLDFGSSAQLREDYQVSRNLRLAKSSDLTKAKYITLLSPISPTYVSTPAWDNSFVLYDDGDLQTYIRESLTTIPVYRIHSDGTVQETRLVNTRALWSASLMAYRDGYLSVTTGAGDPRRAGLFIVNEKKAKRVLKGFMSQPAISPSGCRLAVADDMGPGGRTLFTSRLKIIDLCN